MTIISIIKKATLTFAVIITFAQLTAIAQNDTMYVMKNGVVVSKYSVKTQIDSVVFYNPVNNTVKDVDGNIYNTITIGTQTWMRENLRTTHYNDGTAIQVVPDNATWKSNFNNNTTLPMMCYYGNNTADVNIYGALYNWYVVNTNKLCPAGWHVPTDVDWTTLTEYVGGETVAGNKLKASSGWNNNGNGTDEFNFSAYPSGFRNDGNGSYYFRGNYAGWWSATEYDSENAWDRGMSLSYNNIDKTYSYKSFGEAVRCLKD